MRTIKPEPNQQKSQVTGTPKTKPNAKESKKEKRGTEKWKRWKVSRTRKNTRLIQAREQVLEGGDQQQAVLGVNSCLRTRNTARHERLGSLAPVQKGAATTHEQPQQRTETVQKKSANMDPIAIRKRLVASKQGIRSGRTDMHHAVQRPHEKRSANRPIRPVPCINHRISLPIQVCGP